MVSIVTCTISSVIADPWRGVVPCSGVAVSHAALDNVRRYASFGQVPDTNIFCSSAVSPAWQTKDKRIGFTLRMGAPVTISLNGLSVDPHPSDARTVKENSPVCKGAPEK